MNMYNSFWIILGTIGHVAHGKSTVVKAISGVQVRDQWPFCYCRDSIFLTQKKQNQQISFHWYGFVFLVFQTVRFKNELVRNITIKLGYANAKVNINSYRRQIANKLHFCVCLINCVFFWKRRLLLSLTIF